MKFPHWNNEKNDFEMVEVKRLYVPTRVDYRPKKESQRKEADKNEKP